MTSLRVDDVTDPVSRDNFLKIEEGFKGNPFIKGTSKFITITFSGAVTNFKFTHGLTFIPKDVIQTSLTGTGSLTWNYTLFDKTFLNITTTGPCVVRAIIGTFS